MSDGAMWPEYRKAEIAEYEKTFNVIRPSARNLLLDIDTPQTQKQYEDNIEKINEVYGVKNIETWKSKSGNKHYKLTLNEPLPFMELMVLQAILGSDPKAVLLSVLRHKHQCPDPCVLFQPKETKIEDEDILIDWTEF